MWGGPVPKEIKIFGQKPFSHFWFGGKILQKNVLILDLRTGLFIVFLILTPDDMELTSYLFAIKPCDSSDVANGLARDIHHCLRFWHSPLSQISRFRSIGHSPFFQICLAWHSPFVSARQIGQFNIHHFHRLSVLTRHCLTLRWPENHNHQPILISIFIFSCHFVVEGTTLRILLHPWNV